MNRITHDMTAWGAGIAIGAAIGLSLNDIALGIGVGAAMGAALSSTKLNKENTASARE